MKKVGKCDQLLKIPVILKFAKFLFLTNLRQRRKLSDTSPKSRDSTSHTFPDHGPEIGLLLQRFSDGFGDPNDEQRLLESVYLHLRNIARRMMRAEKNGHTLQPTALVNEAWLKLTKGDDRSYQDRDHFVNVAASAMRQILLDHARARLANRRQPKSDDLARLRNGTVAHDRRVELLALDQALNRLAGKNPRLARIVELRCFGDLSVEETAGVLNLSPTTVKRQWKIARTLLMQDLNQTTAPLR